MSQEQAFRLAGLAATSGLINASLSPEGRQVFRMPMGFYAPDKEGVAMFMVGTPEEVDRLMDAINQVLGLTDVTEKVAPYVPSLIDEINRL